MTISLSRRRFLAWSAMASAAGFGGFPREAAASAQQRVRPVPLRSVRLKPSMFLDSLQTNRRYLFRLEPDRLLHNFRQYAGLSPRAPAYGGWEADTIAGHTLGHYLSALALMHAQTGDAECRSRAGYIVAELAACQAQSADGYVAGFTRKNRDGKVESGRAVFDDLRQGKIDVQPFSLNGSWAPLYTWHKLFAGLLDAHAHCDNAPALDVAVRLGGYLDAVFAQLDDTQMQQMLSCEFGGLNESFVELHARTGDPRWLRTAGRLRHREVLDPLVAQRDRLDRLHANTQIPKLIGMARQFELTGDPEPAAAARFFWHAVTAHHTYVIGGNSDREYFQPPDTIAKFVTDQTCEHCNSYNMLKLTRHLYQWTPKASYFDYYERTLLNHIMAQQHPGTGMFAYMMPLMAGAKREFSTPFGDFWCCVGSGMESHAQFGDSIYWRDPEDGTLFVNLFIPSRVDDDASGLQLELDSDLPLGGTTRLQVTAARDAAQRIALRIPGWASSWQLTLNGERVEADIADGYARVHRRWRTGDTLTMELPMTLRLEPSDDPTVVSVMRGPLVLAADLGSADQPYVKQPDPVLVAEGDVLGEFAPQRAPGHYLAAGVHPGPLVFAPFHAQHDRRSAVYFEHLDPPALREKQARQVAEAEAMARLDAEAIDRIALGEEASEKAHGLRSESSYGVEYRRRKGRDARSGGFVEFNLRSQPGPLTLRLRYWGGEHRRRFRILANGQLVANEVLAGDRGIRFVDVDYPVPAAATQDDTLRVRIVPEAGFSAGPVFGCWLLAGTEA